MISEREQRLLDFQEVARVRRGAPGWCWVWDQSSFRRKSYGVFQMEGVHRLSCETTHGTPTPGQSALHSCDHKWCWNPDHLRWGDQKDNSGDVGRVREARYV